MAYTLNTSHPLYANLVELIGVSSGALVSLKTARTFTTHASTSFGTGNYGEHFRTVQNGTNLIGATFTPVIHVDTYTNNTTVFIAYNAKDTVGTDLSPPLSLTPDIGWYIIPNPTHKTNKIVRGGGNGASNIGSGFGSLATTVSFGGTTTYKDYLNGVLDKTTTGGDDRNANHKLNCIGGYQGQGTYGEDYVWIAVFNRELTAAEILSLHNSLGANNAFGLVQSSGGAASTAISATLANIAGSVASKSNPKTAILATLANVTASVGHTTGTLKTTITATLGNVVGAITSVGSTTNGTFTSEVLKDYAGNVLANTTLNFVRFYNDTTGALVLNKTGVNTNGSGIVTFSDASLVAGVTYRVDWETAAGSRRMPRKAAA